MFKSKDIALMIGIVTISFSMFTTLAYAKKDTTPVSPTPIVDSTSASNSTGTIKPEWGTGGIYYGSTDQYKNTHLWIANRAVEALKKDKSSLTNLIEEYWWNGNGSVSYASTVLYELSWKTDEIENSNLWEGHFYGPNASRTVWNVNYNGKTSPTAYTNLKLHYDSAIANYKTAGKKNEAYRQLGMAVHYMSDLCNPHHAMNSKVGDSGSYHSDFESLVDSKLSTFSGIGTVGTAGTYDYFKNNTLQKVADDCATNARNNFSKANASKTSYGIKVYDKNTAALAIPSTLSQSQRAVAALIYKFYKDLGKIS